MSSSTQDIIDAELRSDETLFWAHVISDEDALELPPKALTVINAVFMLICGIAFFNGLWQLSKSPSDEWMQVLKIHLPLIIGVFLLQWFFIKTNMGRSLKARTKRSLYQNAIISDKRILLFNHSSSERRSLTPSDISDSHMDYENGGLALRFSTYGPEKDSLLVGAADFKTALNIINSHFLKIGPSS